MFTNEELLQMVKDHKTLDQDQLKQLLESGLIQPVEANWTTKFPSLPNETDD